MGGGAENAGPENDGPTHRGWKMQDWNMTDQITRPENAGPENDGSNKANLSQTVYLPYHNVIITCTNILLFLEICLFLLIGWIFGDIIFLYFLYFVGFVVFLCSCYVMLLTW